MEEGRENKTREILGSALRYFVHHRRHLQDYYRKAKREKEKTTSFAALAEDDRRFRPQNSAEEFCGFTKRDS